MKLNLLLTLGHGSSAILVGDGQIFCGYEEERLSHKKSDSSFPERAIAQCLKNVSAQAVNSIYVTHWNPMNSLGEMSLKHWNPSQLPPHKHLITHAHVNGTHHDMHASAALWYAKSKPGLKLENTMTLVVDGFGNFGEHISIYQGSPNNIQLVNRFFGYDNSMGLMYQYMTAFMGMKQHEDEYKILGYETHIHEIDVDLRMLDEIIEFDANKYLRSYLHPKHLFAEGDPITQLDALPACQKKLIDRWTLMCKRLEIKPDQSFESRVVLSYYVQRVLEQVVLTLVQMYKPTNLICSGGVFYNVKLNRKLLDIVSGKLCVFPLAGDQGNALGLYQIVNGDLQWPGHLNWGHRPPVKNLDIHNLHIASKVSDAADIANHALRTKGFVNIVKGSMEFGPRALCNTSTIALPTPAVVNRINTINDRNTVMPMAPVMNRATYEATMGLTNKVHISEQHMIMAMPYINGRYHDVLGAAHKYELEYTGRPQVLDGDHMMDQLLAHHPILINTSFNVHGVPIAFSVDDVIFNHNRQCQKEFVTTIYLRNQS